MKKFNVVINSEEGLHARPASMFSKVAMKIKCDLKVIKNNNEDKVYNPKSILSVLSMCAVKGDELTITADGIDEEEAVEKIKSLVKSDFAG